MPINIKIFYDKYIRIHVHKRRAYIQEQVSGARCQGKVDSVYFSMIDVNARDGIHLPKLKFFIIKKNTPASSMGSFVCNTCMLSGVRWANR